MKSLGNNMIKIIKFNYVNKEMKDEERLYELQKGFFFKRYWNFDTRKWDCPDEDGLNGNCYANRANVIYWYEATLRREYPHKFDVLSFDKLKEEEAENQLKNKIDNMIEQGEFMMTKSDINAEVLWDWKHIERCKFYPGDKAKVNLDEIFNKHNISNPLLNHDGQVGTIVAVTCAPNGTIRGSYRGDLFNLCSNPT